MVDKKITIEVPIRICGDPKGEGFIFCFYNCDHLDREYGFCSLFHRALKDAKIPDPFSLWCRAEECIELEDKSNHV